VDREYYLARINVEREAAERATTDKARTAHLELADQYDRLLAGRRERRPGSKSSS
jgi:hypothetical protein